MTQPRICTALLTGEKHAARRKQRKKVYVVRRHDGSLCTQKQPETAALKAAISKIDLWEVRYENHNTLF